MRTRLLLVALAAMLLPVSLGCGGGAETSYKDRQGTVDPETVEIQVPGSPGSQAKTPAP